MSIDRDGSRQLADDLVEARKHGGDENDVLVVALRYLLGIIMLTGQSEA